MTMTGPVELPALVEQVEALARGCGVGVIVRANGADSACGATVVSVALAGQAGEPIELELGPRVIRLSFAGWIEELRWSEGRGGGAGGEAGVEDREEAAALALDFLAAALFGELRVAEQRSAGRAEPLRRRLEVCVGGSWRVYASRGSLGFAGLLATLGGRVERRLRSNEGRLRRPKALREAGPSGLPSAPWAGAAGVDPGQGVEVAIDGELDLHNFSPKEVGPLVREYIEVCRARGIRDLRIVHGKGKGVLRRTVHSLLAQHEAVESYRLGGHREGSWGATIVRLRE